MMGAPRARWIIGVLGCVAALNATAGNLFDADTLPITSVEVLENSIDSVHDRTCSHLVSLACRVDSFFDDPDYPEEEEVDVRASLQQSFTFYRNIDPKFKTRVRASVNLPNLNQRLRLSFEGNDELYSESFIGGIEETILESTRESLDDPSLRLLYLFLNHPDLDFGVSGGVRLSEGAFYAGPRLKFRHDLGAGWNTKLTHRTYWYTTDNLKTKTELRFDHLIGQCNLFRQSFRSDWDEDKHPEEGFRHTVTTSITQPSRENAALRYAWSSSHQTRPNPRWTSTSLSVGYRQSVWRDWIFLEAAPFVTWEDRFDWEPNPGISISFSTIFERDSSETP